MVGMGARLRIEHETESATYTTDLGAAGRLLDVLPLLHRRPRLPCLRAGHPVDRHRRDAQDRGGRARSWSSAPADATRLEIGALLVRRRARRRQGRLQDLRPQGQAGHLARGRRRLPVEPARRQGGGALRARADRRHRQRRPVRRRHRPEGRPARGRVDLRRLHHPVHRPRAHSQRRPQARDPRRLLPQARTVPGVGRPDGHGSRPGRARARHRRRQRLREVPATQGHRSRPRRRAGQGRWLPLHRRREGRVRRRAGAEDLRLQHQGDRADHHQAARRVRGLVAADLRVRPVPRPHRLRDLLDRPRRHDRPAPPGRPRRAHRRA